MFREQESWLKAPHITATFAGIRTQVTLDETCGRCHAADLFDFGEGDYLRAHVLPNLNEFDIADATRRQLGQFPRIDSPRVDDRARKEAVAVASDVIEAAATTTERIPARSGIGGTVDVRVLCNRRRPLTL